MGMNDAHNDEHNNDYDDSVNAAHASPGKVQPGWLAGWLAKYTYRNIYNMVLWRRAELKLDQFARS